MKPDARVLALLKQQAAPFIIPDGTALGVYRIQNKDELERVVNVKNVRDPAALVRELEHEGSWLMYAQPPGSLATVIAVSERMRAAYIRAYRGS